MKIKPCIHSLSCDINHIITWARTNQIAYAQTLSVFKRIQDHKPFEKTLTGRNGSFFWNLPLNSKRGKQYNGI